MTDKLLTPRELRRYTKQIMIPEIGIEGQERLKQSKVLVIGAGGLGCPVLQYLTAAGAGKIGIVEFDTVDETNLQRQILYGPEDVGKLKSVIAGERLEYLNPDLEVEIFDVRFNSQNSTHILINYDLIIDATDNPESRYIINDASVALGKPMIHGSVFKYEGVISVFNYKGGPSYTDYNPRNEKKFKNPSPGEVGLFGMLPGITGTYMANEAVKIITRHGDVLSGKILLINVLNNTFRVFNVK